MSSARCRKREEVSTAITKRPCSCCTLVVVDCVFFLLFHASQKQRQALFRNDLLLYTSVILDYLYSYLHIRMSLCTGHAATLLGEYMYVMGGNDMSETFGDLWRISLESIKDYVEKQWDMETKIEMNVETSNNRDRGGVQSVEAEEGDRSNVGVGVGRISRGGSSEGRACVVHFKYPVWELLCKNCSSEGTYS